MLLKNVFLIRKKKELQKSGSLASKAFKCRPWHCTRGVSRLFTRSVITRECYNEYDSDRNCYVDKETGELHERKKYKTDYATVIYIRNKNYFKRYLGKMADVNKVIMAGGCIQGKLFELTKEEYYYNYVYELRKGKTNETDESTQLKGNRLYEVSADQLRYCKALEETGSFHVWPEDYNPDPF